MTQTSEEAREQVLRWMREERAGHADVKFDNGGANDDVVIASFLVKDWERTFNFIGNYLKRAELMGLDTPQGRQQLGKALVTCAAHLERAIELYGPMPQPGVPSGEINEW